MKIGFAGNGWGAKAALKSLQKAFSVICVSEDHEVVALLKPTDKHVATIEDISVNTVILAGWLPFIKNEQLISKTFLNIHYSLLPKYRGLHALAWAILNDEEEVGLSIHLVDGGMDAGPILHQKAFKNDGLASLTTITELCHHHVEENLHDVVMGFLNGAIVPQPQDASKASWVGKRGERHNWITFEHTLHYYQQLFRVLQPPYPYPFVKYKGQKLTVKTSNFHKAAIHTDRGRIVNIDAHGVWVFATGGYMIIKEFFNEENQKVDNQLFKLGAYFEG